MNRYASLAAVTALVAAATTTARDADACGGCFIPPSESTVVTGHRMALSISSQQAVLWDQIQYSGDPAEFSWVLPVKPGARVEVASDAFFDVLEAGTQTSIQAPPEGCRTGGSDNPFGCGDGGFATAAEDGAFGSGGGVEVVHRGTVGPYETVTLSAEDPNALTDWLEANGYELPPSIEPTVDAYVNEGFDFIALKLQPGKDVQQMKPVRVVSDAMGYSLPLRMVAAGAGANVDLVLYVIGEGRYEAGNFENATVPPNLVTWDFRDDTSDYAELRLAALGAHEGRTWLTSYAREDPFLSTIEDSLGQLFYNVDPSSFQQASTLADAYFLQGDNNGELSAQTPMDCFAQAQQHAGSMSVVSDLCDAEGQNCAQPEPGQIDRRDLACGELDDVAVALTGMHPADVFLTRLEAKLPVEALDADLQIQAADEQSEHPHRFVAGLKVNACWDSEPADAAVVFPLDSERRLPPGGMVGLVLGAAGLMFLARRRVLRTA